MVKLNRLVLEEYSELEARIKTPDSGDTVQQACRTVLQSSPCAKSYSEKPLPSLFLTVTVACKFISGLVQVDFFYFFEKVPSSIDDNFCVKCPFSLVLGVF